MVVERDGSQGTLDGFKAIFEVELGEPGTEVRKTLAADRLDLADPYGISPPGRPGDVGVGRRFAMPFTTIEDLVVFDRHFVGVVNDNNFPFSVGRHVGDPETPADDRPDDTEFVIVRLGRPLGTGRAAPAP